MRDTRRFYICENCRACSNIAVNSVHVEEILTSDFEGALVDIMCSCNARALVYQTVIGDGEGIGDPLYSIEPYDDEEEFSDNSYDGSN